jgi:hypothetical protein
LPSGSPIDRMPRRPKPSLPPSCVLSELTLLSLIASLESDAASLEEVTISIRPRGKTAGHFADYSRLEHLIGKLQGYADGLRMHLRGR